MKRLLAILTLGLGWVSILKAQNFTRYGTAQGLPAAKVRCLASDAEQNVWAGTERGLAKFTSADSTWRTFNAPELGQISALAVDRAGHVWVGTFHQGIKLVQVASNGQVLSQVEMPDFQRNKDLFINGIAIDKKGNKWLATAEGGVWMIDEAGKWTNFGMENQPRVFMTNTILSIAIDEDDVKWIGTDEGLLSTPDGQKWDTYELAGAINAVTADGKSQVCVSVLDRKGRTTLYCNRELFKNTNKAQVFRIQDILIHDNGTVWAAGTGLGQYVKNSRQTFDIDNSGFNSNLATCLASTQFKGERFVWIGTEDKGVYRLDFRAKQAKPAEPEAEPVLAQLEPAPPPQPEPEPIVARVDTKPVGNKPVNAPVDVPIRADVKPKKVEVVAVPQPEPEPEVKPAPKEEVVINNQKVKKGETINLEKITFVKGSDRLTDYLGADVLVKFMLDNPNVSIELAGHADKNPEPGHPEYQRISTYHLDLSRRRVETMVNYLVKKGVDPARIATQAYGGERPLVNAASPKNMRVELKVLNIN
jgi:outer membrane protein OmpA-like peptidoglycan-associated protein